MDFLLSSFKNKVFFKGDILDGIYLGSEVDFLKVRDLQNFLVDKRIKEELRKDIILFCTHPRTLTLGKRAKKRDLYLSKSELKNRGINIIKVDRGGGVTCHYPSQLLIYPVIKLRKYKLSVKRFVELGLNLIVILLKKYDINSYASLRNFGVWVSREEQYKISSVGLRIIHGVTNHGFSLNIGMDEQIYSTFTACNNPGIRFTSISNENPKKCRSSIRVSKDFFKEFHMLFRTR